MWNKCKIKNKEKQNEIKIKPKDNREQNISNRQLLRINHPTRKKNKAQIIQT